MKNPEEFTNEAQELEHKAEKLDKEAHQLEHQVKELEKEAHMLEEKADELKEEAHRLEEDEHGHEKEHKIIVNGREKIWKEKEISFDQVVILAYGSISSDPNTTYSITYIIFDHKNRPEGSMVKGSNVKVKEGMVFNVTCTNKS
jgi:predicted nuclease with TOPRIM domain